MRTPTPKRHKRIYLAALAVLLLFAVTAMVLLSRWGGGAGPGTSPQRAPDSGTAQSADTPLESGEVQFLVCVDPGHGGSDPGSSSGDRLEKDDNLALGLALRAELEARGIPVIMTREDDSYLSLEDRVALAEEADASLYISLHRNVYDGDACGLEIWVDQNCSQFSQDLAYLMEDALCQVGVQSDRGVRFGSESGRGDYYVLHHTSMPAVLVEMGFLQDSRDNRLLDTNREAYAAALADAVETVFEEEEKK